MMYREFNNSYFTPAENLEIAIGAVQYRDEVIENLREQIKNLRQFILNDDWAPNIIDDVQYKHLRDNNETNS